MKIIFSTILILSTVLSITSCKYEEDDIWDQSAAERIETIIKNYGNVLESSKGGWAMEYYPTNGDTYPGANGYLLLAKFSGDNTVKMAMKNIFSEEVYLEDVSTWDINRDQGPVLSFSSYNKCLHVFADPYDLPFTSGDTSAEDEEGKGSQGDYEFVMVDFPDDAEITMLKGKKRGTYVRMTRLADDVDFQKYIESCQQFTSKTFSLSAPNECYINMADSTIAVYSMSSSLPTLYPKGEDRVLSGKVNPYLVTSRNGGNYLRFRDKIKQKDGSTIQEFRWDEEKGIFVCVENDACTMDGGKATETFLNVIKNSHKYKITPNASMSESLKTVFNNVSNDFAAISKSSDKYSLTDISFTFGHKSDVALDVTYARRRTVSGRTITTTAIARYYFKLTQEGVEDGAVKLEYVEPEESGTNLLKAVPSISQFLTTFTGTFNISPASSKIDHSVLKFTSSTDENLWTTLTYN